LIASTSRRCALPSALTDTTSSWQEQSWAMQIPPHWMSDRCGEHSVMVSRELQSSQAHS
jgi:hypothetical protein